MVVDTNQDSLDYAQQNLRKFVSFALLFKCSASHNTAQIDSVYNTFTFPVLNVAHYSGSSSKKSAYSVY